jgi:hypothetical protein
MNIPRRPAAIAICIVISLLGFVPYAATAQEQHDHAQHATHGAGGAVTQLQLNGTAKWETDASLRAGMAAIREAFDADHAAIHAGKETDAAYAALAARIEAQVNDIVAHCKLPPQADANLHYVIADLLQGASLMKGTDPAQSRHAGAARVHGALIAYGKYFDDPTWKPASMPTSH